MREELIAEPFALRRAADEARDVDELDGRRDGLRGVDERVERREPGVRNRHHAGVRLDGAERIVLRADPRRREGVEERALAAVGIADQRVGGGTRGGKLLET